MNSTCDGTNTNELCMCQLEGVEDAIEHKNSGKLYQQIPVSFGIYIFNDDDLFWNGTYQHYDGDNNIILYFYLLFNFFN